MKKRESNYVAEKHDIAQKDVNRKDANVSVAAMITSSLGAYIETFIIIALGQFLGISIMDFTTHWLHDISPSAAESAEWSTGILYAGFLGIWLIILLYIVIVKKYRPILKSISAKSEGNSIKMLLLGLLIGFVMNGICILTAWLHKDIYMQFDCFKPLSFLVIFLTVFIQSSAEEFVCRGFLYQRLLKISGKPVVAIVGNALLFAIGHLGNLGVTALSIINILLFGIFFSMIVYYTGSIWCAFAVHTSWNFTQNILFGLPNSGMVVPYSVFKLDASTAMNSFAYNVGFGVEGTVMADIVLLLACVVLYLWGRKSAVKNRNDIIQ